MKKNALCVREKPDFGEGAWSDGPKILSERATAIGADYLLFERNEQSGWAIAAVNRRTQKGYSSFSGIDEKEWQNQTNACWQDWRLGSARLNILEKPVSLSPRSDRTFSFIFDTEQLGGVRFGLPRILEMLHHQNVRATFFLTNVVADIYEDVVPILRACNHEVGIHGLCHEFLQTKNQMDQSQDIQQMMVGLKTEIQGANFIGRMNKNTLWALKENGLRYFVFPLKNTRHLLATYSDPIWVEPGLWAIPVFAETYGKSWEAIQRQLDLTLQRMPKRGHLTLLGHPFFDGSNVRLPILEKTVEYLKSAGFQGISLSQTIANPPTTSKKTLRLRPFGASGPKGVAERISNKWFCSRYSSFTTKPKVECK